MEGRVFDPLCILRSRPCDVDEVITLTLGRSQEAKARPTRAPQGHRVSYSDHSGSCVVSPTYCYRSDPQPHLSDFSQVMSAIADQYYHRQGKLTVPSSGAGSQQPLKLPYNEQQGAELITLPGLKCSARLQSFLNANDRSEGTGILFALAPKSDCIEAHKAVKNAMSPIDEAISTRNAEMEEALDRVSFWKSTGFLYPTSSSVDRCIQDRVKSLQDSQSWADFLRTHTDVLKVAVSHTPSYMTQKGLSIAIRPWLRAEERRRVLESDPGPAFDIVAIRLRSFYPEPPKTFTVTPFTQAGGVSAVDVSRATDLLR